MIKRNLALLLVAILTSASAAFAQNDQTPPPAPATSTATPPTTPPVVTPATTPTTQAGPPETPSDQGNPNLPPPADEPSILSRAAGAAYDRHDALPYVNIYLPEGQASIRLRKLIKNVLFESQIDYRFVNGNISTYLRYKYYARNFTYKLSVFDTIEFPDLGETSTQEFQRVRGGLLLFEYPSDYNNRWFGLLQDDRLTFGDLTMVDNRKNNIYAKLGYQYGTQFDERMNGIVGESRGRITPVLTAFREIGPQKTGISVALTESARVSTGDYKYTKLEGEMLRRFDVTSTSFFVSRLHAGIFLTRDTIRGPEVPQLERYSIPQYELFQLGGRDALKSISGSGDEGLGTHELHETNEYFMPIFRNKDYQAGPLHWNTLYGIAYGGVGSAGFEYNEMFKSSQLVADAGVGCETSLTVRDFDVLLSAVYAHTIKAPESLRGGKLLFSIRTIR